MSGEGDPFGPDLTQPARRIFCLHCNGSFRMDQMVYESRFGGEELWRCPNPKCDGAGLEYDLYTEPWWIEDPTEGRKGGQELR